MDSVIGVYITHEQLSETEMRTHLLRFVRGIRRNNMKEMNSYRKRRA